MAAIKRCEEIDAGNPKFAKMDEVLFIAGESSLRLAENKGKQQKPKEKTPENFVWMRASIWAVWWPTIPTVRSSNKPRRICRLWVDRSLRRLSRER